MCNLVATNVITTSFKSDSSACFFQVNEICVISAILHFLYLIFLIIFVVLRKYINPGDGDIWDIHTFLIQWS